MGGEDRANLETTEDVCDQFRVEVGLQNPIDGGSEIAIVRGEVVEAMYLLCHICEIEVGGESPNEGYHLIDREISEDFVELVGRLGATPPPGGFSEGPDTLHQLEQLGTMLADQGVTELIAQSPDVRSQLVVARDHMVRLGEIFRR
jgi:hypothetical protein